MSDEDARRGFGSFRDPAGYVFEREGQLGRAVTTSGIDEFNAVLATGFLARMVAEGRVSPFADSADIAPQSLPAAHGFAAQRVLALTRLPVISFPYEWSFSALKAAALFHLRLHLDALSSGLTMKDAAAFNVQFVGARPIFIDHLSFKPYVEGEYWVGHHQFCRQFLAPLVLTAATGVPFNALYRSQINGLDLAETVALLPLRWRYAPRLLMHLLMPSRLSGPAASRPDAQTRARPLPKSGLEWMLKGLIKLIERLHPPKSATTWGDYAAGDMHGEDARAAKEAFVGARIALAKPQTVLDLGCNAGHYTRLALASGAQRAVGLDFDPRALDGAFRTAEAEALPMLSLVADLTNPSPAQGWRSAERAGLFGRIDADFVLALAVTHHLAFSANIPLGDVVSTIIARAPEGIIEFVGSDDPMSRQLIGARAALFTAYGEALFRAEVGKRAQIVAEAAIPGPRLLVHYRRRS